MNMFGSSVEIADSDHVDYFETLESHLDLDGAVELLVALDVNTEKLKGLVCGWALRKAGLEQ